MPKARKPSAAPRAHAVPPPPPPRQFRQARARESYERILRAALELYSEQGFHAIQTPDIARRASMSVGGLYRYFRDKHQVFAELMHRVLEGNRVAQDQMMAALEARFREGPVDLRDVARGVVEYTWNAVRFVPPDMLHTFQAMPHQDKAFGQLCDQYDRYERQVFARVLGKITSRDVISSPLAAARVIDLIVPTVAIWATLHPDESRGVKEATLDMVHRYLAGT